MPQRSQTTAVVTCRMWLAEGSTFRSLAKGTGRTIIAWSANAEPHQFRTRNDLNKPQRTRSKSNENRTKSTKLIDILPLITVSLQLQDLPASRISMGCGRIAGPERLRRQNRTILRERWPAYSDKFTFQAAERGQWRARDVADCLDQQSDYLCLSVDLVRWLLPILRHHISRMARFYTETYDGVCGPR